MFKRTNKKDLPSKNDATNKNSKQESNGTTEKAKLSKFTPPRVRRSLSTLFRRSSESPVVSPTTPNHSTSADAKTLDKTSRTSTTFRRNSLTDAISFPLRRTVSVDTHYANDNNVVRPWTPYVDGDKVEEDDKGHNDYNFEEDNFGAIAQAPHQLVEICAAFEETDRNDVLSHVIYRMDSGINLHLLTKHISPLKSVHDDNEETAWNVDYLLMVLNKTAEK